MKNYFLFAVLCLFNFRALSQAEFKEEIVNAISAYPSVVSARNQVNSSRADVDSSKWGFYPTPSIGYERSDKRIIGNLNKDTKFLRLQQPIWTAGRLTSQNEKSLALYESYEFALEEQKIAACLKFIQLLSEIQGSGDKISAYKNSESKHLEYVRQIERRATEGFSAVNDVELSMSRLNSIRSDLSQFKSARSQAIAKLEQMLRKPFSFESDLYSYSGWSLNYKNVAEWFYAFDIENVKMIADEHPSVRKEKAIIRSVENDVVLAQSRNMPEIYIRSEIRKGDMTGTDRVIYVGLSSSFGAGLSNLSAIEAAQAKVEVAKSDRDGKLIEVEDSIQSDLQISRFQFERLGQLEITYENNRKYLESSERQYLAGRRTWQEIMNIAREEAQILAQIADAKAQLWLVHQRLQIFTLGLDAYLSSNSQQTQKTVN